MKILFIAPVMPGPAYGRRPFNFIKFAAAEHEVSLLILASSKPTPRELTRMREMGVRDIHFIFWPKWKGALSALRAFPKGIPLRAAYCFSRQLEITLDRLLSENDYDLVHIDRLRLAHLGKTVGNRAKCLVDFTDSLPLYYERTLDYVRNPLLKAVFSREKSKIPSYERRVSDYLDLCLLCSSIDAEVMSRSVPADKIRVIPNMVDVEQFQPHEQPGEPRLIFTGTWTYFPNRDSLFYYNREILPVIRGAMPEIATLVIGARPDKKIYALDGHEGIQVIGPVENMAEALYSNDIFLCPIRFGAGIRNKLLEAMACGMACVSTTLGAEGIPVKDGRNIFLADTPQAFAEKTLELFGDEDLRKEMGRNARELIIATHSHEVILEMVKSMIL